METDLIDRIYECSVVPDLWPKVLDDLASLSGSHGALLFSAQKTLNWTASSTVRDVFAEYVEDGWFTRCSRRVCILSQAAPSFFVEHDFWTEEDMARDPIYRDFFRPRGLGWSAGTGLRLPTGDNIVFSVEAEFDRGPIEAEHIERLNQLRPHLARSAFVTARLGLQRVQGATEALTAMGLPALSLDTNGRMVEANALLDTIQDLVVQGAGGRIRLVDKTADDMLTATLAAIDNVPMLSPRSFPLRDDLGKPVRVVHVVPVKRSALDIFTGSYALVLLTPISSQRSPSQALMRSLFDLTPSEARIASGLAAGNTLEEIAEEGGVAMTTVRSQLRRVLEKTGCTRQAEVTALLANITIGPTEAVN